MSDFWAGLPDDKQAQLRKAGMKYRDFIPRIGEDGTIPDRECAVELLAWQSLASDILESHSEWLQQLKTQCENRGREWNRAEFLRMTQLREHE